MAFDPKKFIDWYKHAFEVTGAGNPLRNWIALDPNYQIVDQDDNANVLLERISVTQANPSDIQIVYKWPREFI